MEAIEAFRLRREKFGQPCMHATIVKECERGKETDLWVCPDCGTEFAKRNLWEKIRQNQKQGAFLHATNT